MVTPGLRVEDLQLSFDGQPVLRRIDLDVAEGQTVVLLGPSGCGKSTLLRAIAGLEQHHRGIVSWAGSPMTDVPAHQRGFGLMFQHHALFPHRTVAGNVAFGLEMQGGGSKRHTSTVAQLLTLVGLPGFEDRSISSLSGGEAQRVALARALAPHPRLLLLDEPLASLDRPLRDRLMTDLRRLKDELGLTMVHVTHDRDEAFALADQLALMRDGRIVTVGKPAEIWARPPDAWVARFIGHHNIVAVSREADQIISPVGPLGSADRFGTTPEHVLIPIDAIQPTDGPGLATTVLDSRFTMHGYEVVLDFEGTELVAASPHHHGTGTTLTITLDLDRIEPLG